MSCLLNFWRLTRRNWCKPTPPVFLLSFSACIALAPYQMGCQQSQVGVYQERDDKIYKGCFFTNSIQDKRCTMRRIMFSQGEQIESPRNLARENAPSLNRLGCRLASSRWQRVCSAGGQLLAQWEDLPPSFPGTGFLIWVFGGLSPYMWAFHILNTNLKDVHIKMNM